MSLPKISIVTPSFNQGDFLEQTLCSVLDQGYDNLEYIVIDGGSTDQSIEIIKKYEKHLHYWVSEKDSGQTHAINKGFEQCTGEVFNWLNSDDYMCPDSLRLIGEAFENPKLRVLCARENRVNSKGDIVRFSRGTTILETYTQTLSRFHIDQPSTYFRKCCVDAVFPLNENFHFLMDAEFWLRYLAKFGTDRIAQIDTPIINFRLHELSKTVSQRDQFQLDKNAIENGLLKALKPTGRNQVVEILMNRQVSVDYKYQGVVPQIKTDTLLAFFSARSIEDLYLSRQYNKARKLLEFVIEHEPELVLQNPTLCKVRSNLKFPNSVLKLMSKSRKQSK